MYEFYGSSNMYPVRGYILLKNVMYQNKFSDLSQGEKRALLDGAGGVKKQRELLDFLTGVDTGRIVNPFLI